MKTLFDSSLQEELIARITRLDERSSAHWGKMNLHQMLGHCVEANKMLIGEIQVKRNFVGRILGPIILKEVMKNEAPLRKNSPTAKELIIEKENSDINGMKEKWIHQVRDFSSYSNESLMHPFFGRMSKAQVGQLAYKHNDHHLRQFGV